MQPNANVKRSLAALNSSFKTVRNRKTIIVFLFVVCFVLYLASSYLLPAHRHFHASQLKVSKNEKKNSCLDQYLMKWMKLMEVNDAIIKKIPASTTENRFYPFTGNGKIAFGMESNKMMFYLKTESNGYVQSYIPTLQYEIKQANTVENKAAVLNLRSGVVFFVTAYDVEQSCVLVEEAFFAHRTREGVFQQDIMVHNAGPFPIELSLIASKTEEVEKTLKKTLKEPLQTTEVGHRLHSVSGEIVVKKKRETEKEGVVRFTTLLSNHLSSLTIPQRGEKKTSFMSLTNFTLVEMKIKEPGKKRKVKRDANVEGKSPLVKRMDGELTELSKKDLRKEHIDAWNQIWMVGVAISSDSDPNSPSPLHVNLTEYYMYSAHHFKNAPSNRPLNCFTGPSTIHTAKQWIVPTGKNSLNSLIDLWVGFFDRNGCQRSSLSSLSLRQLMVLSVIGLQFQHEHLQMALNPLNLRTNISARHLPLDYFNSKDQFDVRMEVTNSKTEPYRIYVLNNGKHLSKVYGCGSACEHVVELGSSMLKFVIHPTDPVTPLFYISTNRTHLEEIRQSDFMKKAIHSAREANANSPHHHMRLSPKFWISVVILIVSFHVVVLKMIYNECRKSRSVGNRRNPFIN